MDLGSLANLSLREIASTLNTKQQEVLLASISVAARFIQQLQAEEQLNQQQQQQQDLDQNPFDNSHSSILTNTSALQQQQQEQQHININNNSIHNNHHHQKQQSINQTTKYLLEEQLRRNSTTNATNTTSSAAAAAAHYANTQVYQDYGQDVDDDDVDDFDDDDELDLRSHHHNNSNNNNSSSRHLSSQNGTTHVNDQSSDISFDDYSCGDQSIGDHSSTADRQTLLTIREFAEELKHRRKSIRLSQKGAAQSLRAFTNGDQPCTDAIIYHFENLQLEPDRAMTLIPLLRHWLEWAEKHRLNGKQLPMMSAVTKVPRERKRKVVLFNEKAKQNLEDAFLKNNHPDRYQLDVISQELNIPTRSIRKWFTNRRQRKRFAEKFSPVS